VRTLALYLAFVFLGGALLAPWLHTAMQWAAGHVPALGGAARMPFTRYVNRGLMLAALAGLPWFIRGMGMRGWDDLGLHPKRVGWRRLGAGFALGLASLAAVCAVALAAGGRVLDGGRGAGDVAARVAGVLATAAAVGVLEEVLFRGAMFNGLRRAVSWRAALAASSMVYAVVHFLARPEPLPGPVTWDGGLRLLPSMLRGAADPAALLPGFLSLTLAGVILCLAVRETGDLWAAVGIHAGWIVWLKLYGYLTDAAPGADTRLWGTGKLIDGWFAFGALVVVLAALVPWLRATGRGAADGSAEAGGASDPGVDSRGGA
jgi:membrane protease YdiL (CAAX protease family)